MGRRVTPPSSRSTTHDFVTGATVVTRDFVTSAFCHGVTLSRCHLCHQLERQKELNHTQRIAHVARQRRSLTKSVVRESVERYLEALAEEIAGGEWVDIPYIGKIQVVREEGKGYVTAITADGTRQKRKVQMRLRTKVRLYNRFRQRCRHS